METSTKFQKLLRQVMAREPIPICSKEDIELSILEMDVFELVGDRYVVELEDLQFYKTNKHEKNFIFNSWTDYNRHRNVKCSN